MPENPLNDASDDPMTLGDDAIAAGVVACLASREPTASACPSEIARALAPGDELKWRALMPRIRQLLATMVIDGQVLATRGEKVLSVEEFEGGPIRIRRGPKFGLRGVKRAYERLVISAMVRAL